MSTSIPEWTHTHVLCASLGVSGTHMFISVCLDGKCVGSWKRISGPHAHACKRAQLWKACVCFVHECTCESLPLVQALCAGMWAHVQACRDMPGCTAASMPVSALCMKWERV